MNRTATLNTPRLVGAFVLALGLLVAGLAVGLGPAGAVIDRGGDEPSISEFSWYCTDDAVCYCEQGADCDDLKRFNPDCVGDILHTDNIRSCVVPDGVVVHPDGTKSAPSEDDTTLPVDPGLILGPGGDDGGVDSGRTATDPNENPDDPDGTEDPDEPENPDDPGDPKAPNDPPTNLPPGVDPGDVLDRDDLPGAEDPGRTGDTGSSTGPDTGPRSGSADSGKGLDLPGVMS